MIEYAFLNDCQAPFSSKKSLVNGKISVFLFKTFCFQIESLLIKTQSNILVF
jgi:hypothetical protein